MLKMKQEAEILQMNSHGEKKVIRNKLNESFADVILFYLYLLSGGKCEEQKWWIHSYLNM